MYWALKNDYLLYELCKGGIRQGGTSSGILGGGLKGDFWEQRLPSCIRLRLEYLHRWSVHNLLWRFIQVRDYSNAERMLAATGFAPMLVNFQRMTAKPKTGGSSKHCVAWKVKKAVHYFVPTDKTTTEFSTDWGKEPQPLEGCLLGGVAQPLYKLHRTFFYFILLSYDRNGHEGQ